MLIQAIIFLDNRSELPAGVREAFFYAFYNIGVLSVMGLDKYVRLNLADAKM